VSAAVIGGCYVLMGGSFDFELCNFTSNRATFEAGVLFVESGRLHISE
jgi:hypothetical protein